MRWVPALLLLWACDEDPCPRGSMLDSVGGLTVTEIEHPTGWGLDGCDDCHALTQIHRLGCTEEVDLVEVRDEVELDGLESCASCHGDNGVDE